MQAYYSTENTDCQEFFGFLSDMTGNFSVLPLSVYQNADLPGRQFFGNAARIADD